MMAFDWYPFNPTDFRRDTYHLCAAADGIYRRLIDEYMMARTPLPDNDAALAAIARVGPDEWNVHRETIRAFFKPRGGKLIHKRCEQELDAQRMLAAQRSHRAKEAATMRWQKMQAKQSDECGEHAPSIPQAEHQHHAMQQKTALAEKAQSSQGNGCYEHAGSNANAMLSDATLQDKTIITTAAPEIAEAPQTSKTPSRLSREELERGFEQRRNKNQAQSQSEMPE